LQKKLPQVQKDMCDMLKLSDVKILTDRVNLMHVSEGTVLCKEGDFNCSLLFVLDGLLMATQKELNGEEATIYYCQPNHFCVNLSVISGEPSLFTIVAKTDSQIAVINKANFHKIITAQPMVVLSLAHFIVKQMSPFVRQIDFALEWNLIESGSALFRQAVKAENIYIVLNGRLRSILKTNETNKQLVGEFGRGDLVGLVEILMETNNATTVVAIRDTEVAQIPRGLLNYIKYRHPRVVTRLIQMLSSKLLGTIQKEPTTPYLDSYYGLRQPIDAPTLVSNLCTVAIMPVSDDVPLHAFTMHLCHALSAIDNTLLLTKDFVLQKLGPSALERVNEYRVCAWLGQQEDHHRIVLYQCESKLTPWTRR
jgi:lysophospholipid hydrolase